MRLLAINVVETRPLMLMGAVVVRDTVVVVGPVAEMGTVRVMGVTPGPVAGPARRSWPPPTGSPKALATVTVKGCAKGAPASVIWLSPPPLARVKPRDSKAPMSQALPCGRGTPRWSRLSM